MVSDVWVAGRQLLSEGEMTSLGLGLPWADRTKAWAARLANRSMNPVNSSIPNADPAELANSRRWHKLVGP